MELVEEKPMTVDKGCVSQLSCSLLPPTTTSASSESPLLNWFQCRLPVYTVDPVHCTTCLSGYHLIYGIQYMLLD